MIKVAILICGFVLMAGCGTTVPVDAVIVKIVDDNSKMGCVGTNKRTVVRTTSGNTSYVCGEYGREGDHVRGYWTEGALDPAYNGFFFTR